MFMINSLSTNDERDELMKTFQKLDINHDGHLSRDELIIGLSQ